MRYQAYRKDVVWQPAQRQARFRWPAMLVAAGVAFGAGIVAARVAAPPSAPPTAVAAADPETRIPVEATAVSKRPAPVRGPLVKANAVQKRGELVGKQQEDAPAELDKPATTTTPLRTPVKLINPQVEEQPAAVVPPAPPIEQKVKSRPVAPPQRSTRIEPAPAPRRAPPPGYTRQPAWGDMGPDYSSMRNYMLSR